MAKQLISIIIPVYNCAQFLPACLDSVLAQTYQNTEILLIENGSTDDSPKICEQYALKDSRVRLIRGPQTSPGAARNLGIREAAGEKVLFVDSDDICEPELAERLLAAANEKPAVLVICGIQIIDEAGNKTGAFQEVYRPCRIRDYITDILGEWKTNPLCGGVYCKLFSLRTLKENDILFEEDTTYAEDFCFNMTYLRHIEGVTILPDLLYRYRIGHPGSLTEKNLRESDFATLWKRRLDVCRAYRETFAFYGLADYHEPEIDAFFWSQAADMLQLSVRRASNFSAFHADMKVLRGSRPDHKSPSGVLPKDLFSLRLLLARMDWPLWVYERGRRRLRIIRNRER